MTEGVGRVLFDAAGNAIKVTQDGSDYKYEFIGKLRNAAGTIFNPATEETLTTIDSVLDSIKDTDGIKKITDSLPAGTNNIGDVDVVSSALPDGAATEATLATRATEATAAAIETELIDIKSTSGVKKITDALPVGDNIIGRTKITDGTDVADVVVIDGVNHVAAGKRNTVDTNNSSVGQLGNGGSFVGTGTDVSQYTSVAISVHSDQDSAEDGMTFEFSQDNSNWDDVYSFNMIASQSETRRFQFPVTAQYFRVNYTNGTETTTEFRAQTLLHRENLLTSIHRVESVVHEDRSAQLVKSVLIAQREGAVIKDFYPVQSDVSGNLKVTTIGADVPSDPEGLVLQFVEDTGSEDMLVDGSGTPVVFERGPTDTDEIWSLRELMFVFTADDFEFDGESFGSLSALTNGIKIEVVKDSVATEIFRIHQNEDFLRVPGRLPLVNNTGPKDVLGSVLSFDGLVLSEPTGDFVRITIQDDLDNTKLKYLTATVFASKVT